MNISPTDYSALFSALDELMAHLPQMQLAGIGRLISGRPEKGATMAATEYSALREP